MRHKAHAPEGGVNAALKVKTEHPKAVITYVRQQNRRGDVRHHRMRSAKTLVDE
ncbi:MAG: hypothetical protein ACREDV_08860 [Methylocella sp.]